MRTNVSTNSGVWDAPGTLPDNSGWMSGQNIEGKTCQAFEHLVCAQDVSCASTIIWQMHRTWYLSTVG